MSILTMLKNWQTTVAGFILAMIQLIASQPTTTKQLVLHYAGAFVVFVLGLLAKDANVSGNTAGTIKRAT